ncbi:MAG: hypothetical protein L0Y54_01795 [Sporichthyaceae bacterium]|nr:hypothetical protein [Sporichthyaceae bacterium]
MRCERLSDLARRGRRHQQGRIRRPGRVTLANDCLYRWYGGAGGTLDGPQFISCNWEPYWGSLAGAGDLNGDGYGDLVGINTNNKCLYRWNGPNLTSGVQVGCGWGPYEGRITGMGNFSGSSAGDVFAVNWSTNCAWRWAGNGSGGLTTGQPVSCGWQAYLQLL